MRGLNTTSLLYFGSVLFVLYCTTGGVTLKVQTSDSEREEIGGEGEAIIRSGFVLSTNTDLSGLLGV
jgi:hypothetical protein